MNTMIGIFSLLLTALVLENAVFSRALDATSLLVIPFGRRGIWLFGVMLTGVTTLSSVLANLINPLMSGWEAIQYLRPVVYILVLTALYGIISALLCWKWQSWYDEHRFMLMLAFFNSAGYGAMALSVYSGLDLAESAVYGFGMGLSFLLANVLLEHGRRCLSVCSIPRSFKGLPAELVYVGILSLSLYGLVGHQLAA